MQKLGRLEEVTLANKKILLVDDSATILMMEKMILGSGPYTLVTATNGQEAVEKAVEHQPDAILMDVVMPQMDGFQACKEIRKRNETRDIPVILVTTRGESSSVESGFASGCNDYITKPINSRELQSKLRHVLGE